MTNQPQQRSPEWFAARRGRVTGSIVGAILDIAPYMTRDEALRSMVRSYHGAESEFSGNIATEYGNNNEDGARWQYELETGNTVKEAFFDTKEDWLGASPDGYVGGEGLIEIKCPFGKRNGGEFKALSEQPHYYAQIQIQLYVTDRQWCDFYQWSPHGSKLERVELDPNWLDENLPVLRQFYAFYLSELSNPEHLSPKRKEINTEATKLLMQEYDELSDAIAQAQERLGEVKDSIIDATGGKDALVWGRKVTKVERKGSVSYAKVVKDHAKGVDLESYRGKPSVSWKIT